MTAERLSLAKDRIHVLLLEGVSDSALGVIQDAGYTNVVRTQRALSPDDLREQLGRVHILGIRSRTQLTEEATATSARSCRTSPKRWVCGSSIST